MSAVTHAEIPNVANSRSSGAGRRFGYLLGIAFNLLLLYLINVVPGWEAASWLTPVAGELVGFANVCLWVGIVVNALNVLADPPWLRALGDAANCVLAAILLGRLLQLHPFDFTGWDVDWRPLLTILLVVALVGTAIAAIVNVVKFFVAISRH